MSLGVTPHAVPAERMLLAAEKLAREVHAGQQYNEQTLIDGHILPVVGLIEGWGYAPEYRAVGFIHDVPEDNGMTLDDFQANFPDIPRCVAEAAIILNKRPYPSHQTYLDRVASNPLSAVGKFADSTCNLVATVLDPPRQTDEKYMQRVAEYSGNIAFLKPFLPSPSESIF